MLYIISKNLGLCIIILYVRPSLTQILPHFKDTPIMVNFSFMSQNPTVHVHYIQYFYKSLEKEGGGGSLNPNERGGKKWCKFFEN